MNNSIKKYDLSGLCKIDKLGTTNNTTANIFTSNHINLYDKNTNKNSSFIGRVKNPIYNNYTNYTNNKSNYRPRQIYQPVLNTDDLVKYELERFKTGKFTASDKIIKILLNISIKDNLNLNNTKNDHNTDENTNIEENNYGMYFEKYIDYIKAENDLKILKKTGRFNTYKNEHLNKMEDIIDQIYMMQIRTQNEDNDVNMNYDITNHELLKNILRISKKKFLQLSLETYNDNASIVTQFLVDLPRHNVYINNTKINSMIDLLEQISKYERNINLDIDLDLNFNLNLDIKNKKTVSTTFLITALLCQSSYFMSFNHLHKKCEKMHEKMCDEKSSIYVFDSNERNTISVNIDAHNLFFSVAAKYRVADIIQNKTLIAIDTEILIDINEENGLIVFDSIHN